MHSLYYCVLSGHINCIAAIFAISGLISNIYLQYASFPANFRSLAMPSPGYLEFAQDIVAMTRQGIQQLKEVLVMGCKPSSAVGEKKLALITRDSETSLWRFRQTTNNVPSAVAPGLDQGSLPLSAITSTLSQSIMPTESWTECDSFLADIPFESLDFELGIKSHNQDLRA